MRKSSRRAGLRLASLVAAFCAGVAVDTWLRVYGPPKPVERAAPSADAIAAPRYSPVPLAPLSPARPEPVSTSGLNRPALKMPIEGLEIDSLKGGFAERRHGRPHEAVDLLAPRNTPVHAVDSGTIAKLFVSKAGGNTIYEYDPAGRLCYYYAHLERYADGLREGDRISQGQIIGYVGTSGNAPASTPHLHFAVFELGDDRRWWAGRAIDPYLVFKGPGG